MDTYSISTSNMETKVLIKYQKALKSYGYS